MGRRNDSIIITPGDLFLISSEKRFRILKDGYYRIYRGEGVCGVNQYVTTSIIEPPKTTTTTTTTTTTIETTSTTESTTETTSTTATDSTTESTTEIPSPKFEENNFLNEMTDEEIATLVEKLQELDLDENNDVF